MNYPIPTTTKEIKALGDLPVSEEIVAAAIAGVIKIARSQGQTLDQITAEVLAEDSLLDQVQRRWLSKIMIQAWESL